MENQSRVGLGSKPLQKGIKGGPFSPKNSICHKTKKLSIGF